MPTAQRLRIEYVALQLISPAERNPKNHDIPGIKDSIRRHGFVEPELLDGRTGRLLAGHGRLEALDEMFAEDPTNPPRRIARKRSQGNAQTWSWLVPTISVDTETDDDAEALLVALNGLTMEPGWQVDKLAEILDGLRQRADPTVALSGLAGTGYSDTDLDAMLLSLQPAEAPSSVADADDTTPDPSAEPRVSRGDVWQVGPHLLMCGDCRSTADTGRLMGALTVRLAFTSPPYASQREYDGTSGFEPIHPDRFVEWFAPVADNVRQALADDGSWFVNIRAHCEDGQRHLYVSDLVAAHVRQWGWRWVDDFVWVDTRNGVPGSWANRFKDAHEPVFHFTRQAKIVMHPLANGTETSELVVYDSDRRRAEGKGFLGSTKEFTDGLARPSNVIELPAETSGLHPAQFPVALPQWFIRAFSDEGDVVYDPFAGSGSTLIAACNENRVGAGMELSPSYCDVILDRLERHTGGTAEKIHTGP